MASKHTMRLALVDAVLDAAGDDSAAIAAGLAALMSKHDAWDRGDKDCVDGEWHTGVATSSGAYWAVWSSPEVTRARRFADLGDAIEQVDRWMPGGA